MDKSMQSRLQFNNEHYQKALEAIVVKVGLSIEKHGAGIYVSQHESLGFFTKEYLELVEACRDDTSLDPFINEAIDLAVVAVKTVASAFAIAQVKAASVSALNLNGSVMANIVNPYE
jgi:hypothetical protein